MTQGNESAPSLKCSIPTGLTPTPPRSSKVSTADAGRFHIVGDCPTRASDKTASQDLHTSQSGFSGFTVFKAISGPMVAMSVNS
jgi:hypothetical protein